MTEWVIEDAMIDPAHARRSREQQRRAILVELESPLEPASGAAKLPEGVHPLELRAEALRRKAFGVSDPGRRRELMAEARQLILRARGLQGR